LRKVNYGVIDLVEEIDREVGAANHCKTESHAPLARRLQDQAAQK
jgi:hypothetical protein